MRTTPPRLYNMCAMGGEREREEGRQEPWASQIYPLRYILKQVYLQMLVGDRCHGLSPLSIMALQLRLQHYLPLRNQLCGKRYP